MLPKKETKQKEKKEGMVERPIKHMRALCVFA